MEMNEIEVIEMRCKQCVHNSNGDRSVVGLNPMFFIFDDNIFKVEPWTLHH